MTMLLSPSPDLEHRPFKPSMWKAMVLSVVLAAAATTLVVSAKKACTSTSNAASSSGNGTWSFQASTTQNDCSGRTTIVNAEIVGFSFQCSTGTLQGFDGCVAESTTANAIVNVAKTPACGPATGRSTHKVNDGSGATQLPDPHGSRSTSLYAGPCFDPDPPPSEEDCESDEYWDEGLQRCIPLYCPIIVATSRSQAYKLTSAVFGVPFDLNADGQLDQVAWTEADSEVAFLAIDRDGDGKIGDGSELFGDHTLPGASNGFEALRLMTLQTNGGITRGAVDSEDPIFARLLLWTDRNHNGLSERRELRPASEVVSDIGLGYEPFRRADGHGNRFRFRGFVHVRSQPGNNRVRSRADDVERVRRIFDVFLRVQ